MALARASGLSAIALTDHDTTEGVAAAISAAGCGPRVVAGCEVSAKVGPYHCHILVYFVSPRSAGILDLLEAMRDARRARNLEVLSRLKKHGLEITENELYEEAGGQAGGRPHIAALLVRKRYASDLADAFDRWIGEGRPAWVARPLPSVQEILALATEDGCVASLAHPFRTASDPEELKGLVEELARLGLEGLEAHYGEYSPEQRAWLARLASSVGLVATGGSDYHGSYKPGLALGRGRGDLAVPDKVLSELESRRG